MTAPSEVAQPQQTRTLHLPAVIIPERLHMDCSVLLWQDRGASEVCIGGEPWELEAGQALWIPAGSRHSLHVFPNSIVLPMMFRRSSRPVVGPRVLHVDRDMHMLFLSYLQHQNSIIRSTTDVEHHILDYVEGRAVLAGTPPLPISDAALTIAELLQGNPGDTRSVRELAQSVHASVRTIERQFLAETGMTLRQWRTQYRLETALEMLRAGRSVDMVAHYVGYSDVSAFGRAFKRHHGCTPGAYADRFRE